MADMAVFSGSPSVSRLPVLSTAGTSQAVHRSWGRAKKDRMTAATDAFPETSARQQPRRRHSYLKEHTGRAARSPVLAIKHSPRSDAWWTTSTARSSRWLQLGASQTIPQSRPVRLAAQLRASTAWRTCQCQMMRWSIETEMIRTTEVRSARREFIPKRGDSRYGSNIN